MFLIDRGHDGPARVGSMRLGETAIATPSLIGPTHATRLSIHYSTLNRDKTTHGHPVVFSLPFSFENELMLGSEDLLILPSMIAGESLGTEAGGKLLEYQEKTLREIKTTIAPSQTILRVPSSLDPEAAERAFRRFDELGVKAAAFQLNCDLGPSDFNSILLRRRLPRSWLALLIGRVEPFTLPVLYYLGFDILDVGHAFEAAARRMRLWRMDSEIIGTQKSLRLCTCPACVSLVETDLDSDGQLAKILTEHNLTTFEMLMSECTQAMHSGKLRWLVESMTHASPSMAAFLRRIDGELYSYLEEFTPTTARGAIPLIGPESYNSPMIRRFRERVVSRYRPPGHKRIILLLPCSARKPYSNSKSHKRFFQAIETALGPLRFRVAETILTSPLGVIPRELERMPPAAQYDIPVTGEWDAEETEIAVHALEEHLQKFNESTVVVAHVSGGYLNIVKKAEGGISQSIIYTTSDESATSRASLKALQDTLRDMADVLDLTDKQRTDLEDTLRASSDYQFGHGAGDLLIPEGASLRGKLYHTVTSRVHGEQVCAYVAKSGTLSLTLAGGRLLEPFKQSWVRFEGKEIEGGSIFAVGVREADPGIRPGDEVIVLDSGGQVAAVGKSEMSGLEMCELDKGRAVTLRHKVERGK
ncbi:MAG: DUF5591 domain-containing protein [Candidatus Thorarchaeota archaeon]